MFDVCSCFEIVYCKLLILLHGDSTMFFIISIFEWCWHFFQKHQAVACEVVQSRTGWNLVLSGWRSKGAAYQGNGSADFLPSSFAFSFAIPFYDPDFCETPSCILTFWILWLQVCFYLRTIQDSEQKLAINSFTVVWKKPPVPLGLIDKACRSSYSYADARRTLWARQTAGGVGSREGEGNIAIKTQGDNGF